MSEKTGLQVSFVTIGEDHLGQRIDNFLITHLKGVPKSAVYKILRKGEVRVNKKRIKPVYKLQLDDVIRIPPIKVAEKDEFVPKKLDKVKQLEEAILFEDKYLMVINKPSGMAVHGGSGLSYGLIEALRVLRPEERSLELVHRLDRDTSGCLLISKRRSVLTHLHQQLREKTMEKNYWALVDGQWDAKTKNVTEGLRKNTLKSGERVVRVDNTEGKPSHTRFRVLERYAECSLVQASPVTGRTHQIRVHTQCKGHPIACDDKYGVAEFDQYVNKLTGLNRLFLHAHDLRFIHPKNETTMHVEAPLDKALSNCIKKLRADNEQV
ncbi:MULTISPECIES: 23S rRNA pseudouridine(955/2504/2580) synthase RluC [Pseudoalteromonas]|jgi:23S rRNA pseudouridine955/2504/2580 synthase|uniref:Pseudouridine synthase n=1 Tax=Pseudoalteromonas lipolytica TaxID=570156 RepID=A0AAD0S017_9GAMM|nr:MULTISPECIES: 23S rRNA pseudouridine(955/2504/2580) synthase RluC [Pseudoalteromonas]AXV65447.1 23S rRNA pseudouridine(955/2504/2580) synthase RluC [Pseudoalteromonas donghaensis]EWH06977.1 23S rRNA pseudouridylate synthase [Pseudoalteromonas lipolytica SCSIO 04301]QMW13230.1 23S rRNA pseudouridine(955/2504/2580) synthase RluC [Pseudoalteromonas sp. MT33b]QPL41625.1 23S rRNA pseudouridine(955/2504/2580) synthase RluC [Pseudoalteromonas sp. A41-2]|tara:strand:+ start:17 stop:985 length:969 start_codon:yes stop_codon:yes gene_type:complete